MISNLVGRRARAKYPTDNPKWDANSPYLVERYLWKSVEGEIAAMTTSESGMSLCLYILDEDCKLTGARASSYSNGKHGRRDLLKGESTWLQRWEHWICPRGEALKHMTDHGWRRVALPGKKWASGSPAYTYQRQETP